jgi:hypothetical protein
VTFSGTTAQVLLVERVVPYHSLHLRNLAKGAERLNGTATLSVEEAKDREATWIEFAMFYSLGSGRVLQWLDRRLINPILHLVHSYGAKKAFRRLQALLEKPHSSVSSLDSIRRNTTEHEEANGPS